MTAQYTATQQLLPSKLMADAFAPSKVDTNVQMDDTESFSNVLDNASKSYTDKSEVQTNTQHTEEYVKETKSVQETKSHRTHEEPEKIQSDNDCSKDSTVEEKTCVTENKPKSESESTKIEGVETEDVQNTEQHKTVEQLIEEIKINATAVTEEAPVIVQNVVETIEKNVDSTVDKKQQSNKIATEQLMSNVEFENVDLEDVNINVSKNIDADSLKKLVEKAQTDIDKNTQQLKSVPQAQLSENIELKQNLDLNNIQIQSDSKVDVAQNIDIGTESTLSVKTTKENLAADTARLAANLDEIINLNPEKAKENAEIKGILPTDTLDITEETTPVIKVTEEVASQVKESFINAVENKDNTAKIKDKAVETMTTLQDKDSLVTGLNTNDSNNTSSGFSQNNAGETAVKLAVEANTFNSQPQTSETFVNKLDAQLATRETSVLNKTLSQNDILSQVTTKFEQLQQQAGSKVSIVLQPESLGRVSVEIMNTKDGIVAKMTTDTQQVKELFDKSIESLKSNLSAQGVNVNNIKVECTHESTNNAMNFERDQFNQSFNNQQNGHNTNKSDQNTSQQYGAEFKSSQDSQAEEQETSSLKNNNTIIKHNGKVDYSV